MTDDKPKPRAQDILVRVAELHGFDACRVVGREYIAIDIPWTDRCGIDGIDTHIVHNMEELREVLGY